jgi:hypothetical protein
MATTFDGLFAFTLQGFMHAQNIETQIYIPAQRSFSGGGDPDEPTSAGGNAVLTRTSVKLNRRFDLPVLSAFYPKEYPPPPTPPPPRPPSNPRGPGTPCYSPNVGYYPYVETGVILFVSDLTVSGWIRVNTAGLPSQETFGRFVGSYRLDPLDQPMVSGSQLVAGLLTIHFDAPKPHVWDYSIIALSLDEIQMATSGRIPRPAVASGAMRRIASDAGTQII